MAVSQKLMSAWTHTKAGHPANVLALTKIPIPPITSPTHVLVKISHCSLNPGTSIIMQLVPSLFRSRVSIPEADFSGTVIGVGSSVPPDRGLNPGVSVFGSIPIGKHVASSSGALAENVVVEHSAVVEAPSRADIGELSGLPIAGTTALELIKAAKLKRGDSVLVNGASGGIGHLVLQMCKEEVGETGRVVAVCSTDNVEWVKEYGADEVIDYKLHSPVHSYLTEKFGGSRFDAIIDAVGIQDVFENCPSFLAQGKPYVTVGPHAKKISFSGILATLGLMAKNMLWPRILGGVPRDYIQVTGVAGIEEMKLLASQVANEKLKVRIDTIVEMENAQKAYDRLLSGHTRGKIVVKIP